jgi:hypothetical protein
MAALGDWKLIHSLYDGRRELYHLPDEQTRRSPSDAPGAGVLQDVLQRAMDQEEFWAVYVHGEGKFAVRVAVREGELCLHLLGKEPMRTDPGEIDKETEQANWWRVDPQGGTRVLFAQSVPHDPTVAFNFRLADAPCPDQVFLGPKKVKLADVKGQAIDKYADAGPYPGKPYAPTERGFHVFLHRPPGAPTRRAGKAGGMDEATRRQLEGLGYLR